MILRNTTYYFKRRVPKALSEFYTSSKFIVKSLNTSDKQQAELQNTTLSLELDKLVFLYESTYLDSKAVSQSLTEAKLTPRKSQSNHTKTSLLEFIQLFMKDSMLKSKWSEKTHRDMNRILEQFVLIIGNKSLEDTDRDDLWKYRDALFALPMNYTQKKEYKHLSIDKILKMEIPEEHKSSVVTVDKKLIKVASMFRFAHENRYIKENPSTNLSVNGKTHMKSYKAYSKDDVSRLMSLPLYYNDVEGIRSKRPEWYWLPLIALYSGMRQTEIAQLYKSDVRLESEVWVFDLNTNTPDKRLKNKSSHRLVPIHKKLIELGLLDYVSSLQDEERLWMNLSNSIDGYATNFTKHYYTKFNRTHITQDKLKVFHSFRKTFVTNLEQLTLLGEINHTAVKAIVGHSFSNDITINTYTQGFDIRILKEVVDKFNWG